MQQQLLLRYWMPIPLCLKLVLAWVLPAHPFSRQTVVSIWRGFLENQVKFIFKESTAHRVITGNNSITATETVTEPCDGGGSTTTVVNDADNNQVLSTGDKFSVEFQNCNDGEFIYNGKSSLEFLLVEGDIENEIPPYRFQVKTVLENLNVTDCCQSGSDSFSVNGDITMTLNQPDSSNTLLGLQGDSLRIIITGTESGTVTLKTYLFEVSENESTGVLSLNSKGMLDSTFIGGSVSFDTPQALVGGLNDENPSSGVMVINGANGSKQTLTVIDNTRVELAVDANGDGVNETTIPVTWDELVE